MGESELYEAILGTMDYSMVTGQYLMTMLTGYLLIAFFVGDRLTFFQVSFVNAVFVVMYLAAAWSLRNAIERVGYFVVQLEESGSEIPVTRTMALSGADGGGELSIVISSALVVGCLFFMWSVRHPKKE